MITNSIPSPLTVLDVTLDDGSVIRVRRHGNPNSVRMLLSHGNGFAADAYFPFWGPLLEQFDLLLFDFRNHGWNERSAPERHNYAQMVRDLNAVIDQSEEAFGRKPAIGVFHSMSARTAMKHAIEVGWRWSALALFDPPNVPPPGHPVYHSMEVFENRLVGWASARRDTYPDPEVLAEEYMRSRTSRLWVEGVQDLMARSVLRRETEGIWRLVCSPALEASIYAEALTMNLWPAAARFGGPIRLIGADPDLTPTGVANKALGTEGGFDYVQVLGAGHLLQIEKPDACRAALVDFLAQHGVI